MVRAQGTGDIPEQVTAMTNAMFKMLISMDGVKDIIKGQADGRTAIVGRGTPPAHNKSWECTLPKPPLKICKGNKNNCRRRTRNSTRTSYRL